MKFDAKIISILTNFCKFNRSIIIKPGNKLQMISVSRDLYAESIVPVVFDKTICIYDLEKLLNILKLFKDPELVFEDTHVLISENINSVNHVYKYMYASESTLEKSKPPEKRIEFDNVSVSFKVTKEVLENISKVVLVSKLPDVTVTGDGQSLFINVEKTDEPDTNGYSVKLGDTDKKFKAIFNSTTMNILKNDYDVEINKNGISKFTGEDITYWISVDYKSKF